MQIKELSEKAGISTKAIRYYESIKLLPSPKRLGNNYRTYDSSDIDRLKLVTGAARLGLTLEEIAEILALRDRGEAPCRTLLNLLEHKAKEIHLRIEELKQLEEDLLLLHEMGLEFPTDDIDGKNCVCHLVSEQAFVSRQ